MTRYFNDDYQRSRGEREDCDIETLRTIYPHAKIKKSDARDDRRGSDYTVKLRGGATIHVDAKYRDTAKKRTGFRASSNWRVGPEFPYGIPDLTLEEWSVEPGGIGEPGKAGWTLDTSKITDYILWTWHPLDTRDYLYMPFQLLSLAFRLNLKHWRTIYRQQRTPNKMFEGSRSEWHSVCYYVPANIVIDAMNYQMKGPCVSLEGLKS